MKKLIVKIRTVIEKQLHKMYTVIMEWTYERSQGSKFRNPSIAYKMDLETIKKQIKEQVPKFTYKNDRWFGMSNHIKEPKEVLMNMFGDCDDWASYIVGRCENYKAYIMTYFRWNIFKAHTVAIVKNPETCMWVLFDWRDIQEFRTIYMIEDYLNEKYKMRIFSKHLARYSYEDSRYYKVWEAAL